MELKMNTTDVKVEIFNWDTCYKANEVLDARIFSDGTISIDYGMKVFTFNRDELIKLLNVKMEEE